MSHQDVVEAPGSWRYPPYSGTIAEGKLWGRGALDVKGNLYSRRHGSCATCALLLGAL